jgi:hypothetical protein
LTGSEVCVIAIEDSNVMKIEFLIAAYLDAVGECISELLDEYSCKDEDPEDGPVDDLLRAWREQRIPTSGNLPSGRSFTFHGQGCRFEHRGKIVEMGFTPEGRWDGFDAYRVHEFSDTNAEFGSPTIEAIASALKELENLGIVELRPNSTLYVFRRLQ